MLATTSRQFAFLHITWAKQKHSPLSWTVPVPNGKGPTWQARHSSLMLTACSLVGRIHFCEQKNLSVLQAAASWQAYKFLVTAPQITHPLCNQGREPGEGAGEEPVLVIPLREAALRMP